MATNTSLILLEKHFNAFTCISCLYWGYAEKQNCKMDKKQLVISSPNSKQASSEKRARFSLYFYFSWKHLLTLNCDTDKNRQAWPVKHNWPYSIFQVLQLVICQTVGYWCMERRCKQYFHTVGDCLQADLIYWIERMTLVKTCSQLE